MKLLNKLRVRLVLWTVALEAVLLVVFAVVLVAALRAAANRQLNETLRLSADQLNAVVDVRDSRYDIPAEDTAAVQASGVLAWILTSQGTVGATIGRAAGNTVPAPLPLPQSMGDAQLSSGEPVRLFVAPLREGDRRLGTLVVGVSLREGQNFTRQVLLSLAISLPIVLALSAGGGLFLAGRALSPVDVMTTTAQHIRAADLSQRIDLDLPDDEIGRLARTFNAMLERLDHAFQHERQLTSDVSHELRTPLGMLKTQLSLARSRPREAPELLQMMADMEGDVDRMTRLVEQMLTLARVEQRGLGEITPIDLGDLVETIVQQFQETAAERGITVRLERPPQVNLVVAGDAERLRQVFTNLLDNAIKYTDSGGLVHVTITRRWEEIWITIADSGTGIDADHLPHVFERFYRVDSARARNTGGSGLGLAITQAIVHAHQGTIRVESQPGQGTTFTMTLPRVGISS